MARALYQRKINSNRLCVKVRLSNLPHQVQTTLSPSRKDSMFTFNPVLTIRLGSLYMTIEHSDTDSEVLPTATGSIDATQQR